MHDIIGGLAGDEFIEKIGNQFIKLLLLQLIHKIVLSMKKEIKNLDK